MSTTYSRYFSALARYQNGDPIDDRDFDGEFDAMVIALNRKVLCSGTEPSSPINGQTWSDTATGSLKLYKTNVWATLGLSSNVVSVTADTVLTAATSQNSYDNTGASALVTLTLPTCAANLVFIFHVTDTDGIKVLANTGDTIRLCDVVSKAAGYAKCTQIGGVLKLVGLDATQWLAEFFLLDWEVEIS